MVGAAPVADQRHQHDRRGVVEPGLGLERAGQPPRQRHPRSTENTAAASVGEVTAPSSTASSQRQPEQVVAADRHHRTLTATPTVASETPEPHRPAGSRATGGQTALGQDHGSSAAKPSAWASSALSNRVPSRLAEHDAHEQVDQQARQPGPTSRTAEDRQEQHGRPTSSTWSSLWTSKVMSGTSAGRWTVPIPWCGWSPDPHALCPGRGRNRPAANPLGPAGLHAEYRRADPLTPPARRHRRHRRRPRLGDPELTYATDRDLQGLPGRRRARLPGDAARGDLRPRPAGVRQRPLLRVQGR